MGNTVDAVLGGSRHSGPFYKVVKYRDGKERKLELRWLDTIGKGAFGNVEKMSAREVHEFPSSSPPAEGIVALKTPDPSNGLDSVERDLFLRLRHKNVCELLFYFQQGKYVYLGLEFVEGSDLHRCLVAFFRREGGIGILAELFAYQMFRGLAHCHSRRVCHRDIKPENLLVNPITGVLKITDFGCGTQMHHDVSRDPSPAVQASGEEHTFYIGTRFFRAPELLLGAKRYSYAVDVWSGAMVVSEMILGRPIFFGGRGQKEHAHCIFRHLGCPTEDDFTAMNAKPIPLPSDLAGSVGSGIKCRFERKKEHLRLAPGLLPFLEDIFVYNPARRPTAWEACGSPYFDCLKDLKTLPSGNAAPKLYDFSIGEVASMPDLARNKLNSPDKYLRIFSWFTLAKMAFKF